VVTGELLWLDSLLAAELELVEVSELVAGLLDVVVEPVPLEELDVPDSLAVVLVLDDAARSAAFFAAARLEAAALAAAAFAAALRSAAVCPAEEPAAVVLVAAKLLRAESAGSCPEASCT
jgi:hypothetical protein